MKQKSTKILVILIALILIVGAIMIGVKGLAFELKYQNGKQVEIDLGKEFDIKDMQAITNEVFGKQAVLIEQIEVYKDAANIITTDITEEQKADLVTKINEKYGTELSADNITIEEHSKIRGRDLIKPYIAPFAIATAIILVYFMIRYYKLNSLKVLKAFQDNNLSEIHFGTTTGYGYSDIGRETIEKIYAQIFKAEDSLVRNQFISGTHALTVTLFGLLRPGDTLLSITGEPYDTLHEVIGIKENHSSLKSFGVNYEQIELINNDFDYEKIQETLKNSKIKLIEILIILNQFLL